MVYKYDPLTISDVIKKYRCSENINFICPCCNEVFLRTKKRLIIDISKKRNHIVCSKKCQYKILETKMYVRCKNCDHNFIKKTSEIKKSLNHFCSMSCSATFNNTHKTHGNRRSKLEVYLEEQIRNNYPEINLICNQKEAINSELDFYFPDFKLAIELNGIFHYEPIYGEEKLSQIQNNDDRKFQACLERGIELCIIDSSKCTYLKQSSKDKFYEIVKKILELKTRPAEN